MIMIPTMIMMLTMILFISSDNHREVLSLSLGSKEGKERDFRAEVKSYYPSKQC